MRSCGRFRLRLTNRMSKRFLKISLRKSLLRYLPEVPMKSVHISCVVLFVAIVPFSLRTFAQQGDRLRDTTPATSNSAGDYVEGTDSSERTKAIDEADSRAEKEAERLVSIPPEKIVLMLQQEPGLFLEVKKLLVRRAYSQGQVLDPKDLTDNAVFRLVRDDEEVRA